MQGALNGLQIGAFNFVEDDDRPIKYYHDSNNNLYGEIPEIVVYPNKRVANALATAATFETAATGLSILNGVDYYSGKVRVATNGKIYLPKSNGVFYGNQFVKTAPVKNLKYLGKYSMFFSAAEDFANFNAAGAHGLSSGVFNALNGDNFWNGLISGAASSGIGSYAQSVNLNTGLMVASTTTMGGIVAWATGDDFLQGAMQGMQIGILNHSLHDGDEGSIPLKVSVTTNEAGMYEVTVIGARKGGKENILAIAAEINTITDCFGTSLKKNSGNTHTW